MKKTTLYTISLIASGSIVIIGALFKIQHWAGASLLFSLAMIFSIPFIFLGVIDVFQNKKNEPLIKLMWTIGFIFLSLITGLVYQEQFRKRNVN